MIILATDYIDSLKDENGNVPALLNCGIKSKNRIILLRISADLAKYLYLSKTAVYYTAATRYQYKGKTISQDYYDRLKRNLARFPRSWDTNSYPFEVEEESYLMSANMIEITRDDADEFDKKRSCYFVPNPMYTAVIEDYHISDRFILIDLERPKKRVKQYRRCGFSTKKW